MINQLTVFGVRNLICACGLLLVVSTSGAQNLLQNGNFDFDGSHWESADSDITLVFRADTGSDLGGGSGNGSLEVQHAFWSGLLVNLLNPKAVLFAAAVLIVIFPGKLSLAEGGILVTNHLIVEWGFYTVLAIVLSTKTVSARYLRAKVYLDRFAALVLGGLGARLLLAR